MSRNPRPRNIRVDMADGLAVPGPSGLEDLFNAHGRALRAFVGSRVRDPGVVEDICQETFVVALDRGVPEDGVGRWLFAIARNKVLKHMRDAKPTATAVAERPARSDGPGERLLRVEQRQRVRRAVADLDEDLREVIRLRYEGDLDYRQIADHLELPFTTVQGRLKRARVALRRALRGEVEPS